MEHETRGIIEGSLTQRKEPEFFRSEKHSSFCIIKRERKKVVVRKTFVIKTSSERFLHRMFLRDAGKNLKTFRIYVVEILIPKRAHFNRHA